jgi:hypothetical protein
MLSFLPKIEFFRAMGLYTSKAGTVKSLDSAAGVVGNRRKIGTSFAVKAYGSGSLPRKCSVPNFDFNCDLHFALMHTPASRYL